MSDMGPVDGFSVDNLESRFFERTAIGGAASLSERNATIIFKNGSSNYTYVVNSSAGFPEGSWQKLTKEGSGEITIAGAGYSFDGPLGNVPFKLDGEAGYFAWWELQPGGTVIKYGGSVKAV